MRQSGENIIMKFINTLKERVKKIRNSSIVNKVIQGAATLIFCLGKPLQTAGQAVFSAGLDDKPLGLPDNVNQVMSWIAMAGTFSATVISRIPKFYEQTGNLLARCRTKRDNPEKTTPRETNSPSPTPSNLEEISLPRRIVYKTLFWYFTICGALSAFCVTLNAIQSGAILMEQFEGKNVKLLDLNTRSYSPTLFFSGATNTIQSDNFIIPMLAGNSSIPASPDALVYFGATYVPASIFLTYITFNLVRIIDNARSSANLLARIGLGHHQWTKREIIALTVASIFTLSYTVGNTAFAIVNTESAIMKINELFFQHPEESVINIAKYMGIASCIPSIASTILTCGADLYHILTGKISLFHLEKATLTKGVLFSFVLISGLIDAVMSNAAGFFGSIFNILTRFGLSENSSLTKGLAGFFALTSIPPYFANNGAQALKSILNALQDHSSNQYNAIPTDEEVYDQDAYTKQDVLVIAENDYNDNDITFTSSFTG